MSVVMKSTGGLVRESGVGRSRSWRLGRVKVLFVCMMRLSVEWSGVSRVLIGKGWREGISPRRPPGGLSPAAKAQIRNSH